MKGNSRLTSFTRSPAFQNSNYAKHTSYALLSSPWRPRYLSENAEAGQRQREGVISGSPGLQWGRTQMEGMRLQCGTFSLPLAWQMLAFCIVLFCFETRSHYCRFSRLGNWMCRPEWPHTHRNPPVSASQVLELNLCTTILGLSFGG